MRTVVLRDEGGLRVWATLHGEGSVSIEGQDLSGVFSWSEYEYAMTIAPSDVPRLVEALGGSEGDDVLDLLYQRRGDLRSEKSWLEEHEVPHDFWNRIE